MDWSFIGVFAEVISAVAVVVTIIFLAFEVRNSRNATQSASIAALSVGFNETNYNLVGDGEFAKIFQTGHANPEELDDIGKIRFSMYMQCYANHYTALRRYHELEVLPEEKWQSYLAAFVSLMSTPGGMWLKSRLTITPALLAEIEAFGPPIQEYGWNPQPKDPPMQ